MFYNSYPSRLWTLDSGLSGHIIQDLTRLKGLGIAKPLRDIRLGEKNINLSSPRGGWAYLTPWKEAYALPAMVLLHLNT